ncbi:MAG: hypothetical protein RI601_00605 [Desulfurivibrionaceae bacterium]|nr:hypothetical protein [Desulfurivibrionaceae bacterium]
MTPSPENPSPQAPLTDLDNDLGDDWESAFQAEEFMISPEDEPSDFFLLDENEPDSNEDIADLFSEPEDGNKEKSSAAAQPAAADSDGEGRPVRAFPNGLQILAASLLQLVQGRPRQRLVITTLAGAITLLVAATLFFRATDGQNMASAPLPVTATSLPQKSSSMEPPAPQQSPKGAPPSEPAVMPETVQQQWQLPTFVIVAGDDSKVEIIVNIDLILTANLAKGQTLPDDKQIFTRDIIYQFYANRPAYELKRYALARGDMISQLQAWLNRQWQNNPFETIIFSRYEVIQTSPPLNQKVTFM